MIENKQTASVLNDMILKMGADLDQSLQMVKASCPESEFLNYREFVSSLLNTMLLDFMNPLYKRHPELKPPALT
ncbi:hypothetical protein [Burkholderia ubonensis]|uniref:Cytoplasmic protein n=1 Tax=Burkholderia ubonensis TaxID=101571 RepID=A0AB74DDP0_9BURK|nr:hypothetical protein [Burkholderia ubonensis]PAJ78371.1 hypothetical protein CJO71_24060 [Burkholderia ubonensis]PAJ84895.1 hypothetical protein CJO70_25650 [Burkholderia ubonensis]PAJ91808.1 hypothetical protein CJO69_25280 [Burkholderia ubonensis]PAJ98816.1 hypothetical protein CJO68_22935 [Burkholderia ubonensis]PAK04650.1 hypothetical protein CJO67_28285 [Burkholderia ubonensis]